MNCKCALFYSAAKSQLVPKVNLCVQQEWLSWYKIPEKLLVVPRKQDREIKRSYTKPTKSVFYQADSSFVPS